MRLRWNGQERLCCTGTLHSYVSRQMERIKKAKIKCQEEENEIFALLFRVMNLCCYKTLNEYFYSHHLNFYRSSSLRDKTEVA